MNKLELRDGVRLAVLSPREHAARFNCCDPSPTSMTPRSELSEAGKARRDAWMAELAAEEEAFEARMRARWQL